MFVGVKNTLDKEDDIDVSGYIPAPGGTVPPPYPCLKDRKPERGNNTNTNNATYSALVLYEQMNNVDIKMNFLLKDGPIYNPSDKISISKSDLIKIKSESSFEFIQTKNKLKEFYKQKKSKLDPSHKLHSTLDAALSLLDLENIPSVMYNQLTIDKIEKMIKYSNAYQRINETLKKKALDLKYYNDNIYNQILWRFQEMEVKLDEIKHNLSSFSYVQLEISKWRSQNIIRDVKAFFRKVSNETSVKESLDRSFGKLEDSIVILIETYKQIERMKTAKSKSYIDSTYSGFPQNASDVLLNDGVLALKHAINRNLVFTQYEIAMNAFSQRPFFCSYSYVSLQDSQEFER